MQPWFHPAREIDRATRAAAAGLAVFDETFDPGVRPADPRFGDLQANGVLPFAKRAKTNPREAAAQLVAALEDSGALDPRWVSVEVAGPGFLNFTLSPEFLLAWLQAYRDEAGLAEVAGDLYRGVVTVVDYPSPNTAKQMHIGHLRPMVIGEAIQRLLRFCGAAVVRDNHIGDWGTNFGTLIMAVKRCGYDLAAPEGDVLDDIEKLYKIGTAMAAAFPSKEEEARAELVKLQEGDPGSTALWEAINAASKEAFHATYRRLGLELDTELGESFYRDKVDRVYAELAEAAIAEESEGALVVYEPGHPRFGKDVKRPQPFIIRKSDGASNYASTDLATLLYRHEEVGAKRVVYVTDARQQDHFQQLFLCAKRWFEATGRELPELHHVWFGTILGEEGKPFTTRKGETIRLVALLDEAEERAYAIVTEKSPHLDEAERREIARVVGLGAVRYADLMQNRTGDYIFSWKKLLTFDGNSAPYLLMAVARIYNIFQKADVAPGEGEEGATALETESEIALARKLVAFPDAVSQTLADLRPHVLCTYLFELAGTFSGFYNADRVIGDDPAVQARRMVLCTRTLRILETGLHLLGLETLERM